MDTPGLEKERRDCLERVRSMLRFTLSRPEVPLPPDFLARFLAQVWAPYLARQLESRGDTVLGPAERLTQAMLVSLLPAPTREHKARLKRFVAELLPLLREAMALSPWPEGQRREFIDSLAEWHISIIQRGEPPRHETAEQKGESTVPLTLFSSEYRDYLEHFENGIEVIDLKEIAPPWVPGSVHEKS